MACTVWVYSCKNNEDEPVTLPDASFSLNNGSIIINNQPNIVIKTLNQIPEGVSTSLDRGASAKGLKSLKADEDDALSEEDKIMGNNYRLGLIGEVETLEIDGVKVQATHVKIEQVNSALYYAYVTYNEQGDGHHGAIVVFKVVVTGSKVDDIKAEITVVTAVELAKAELSAVDVYNNKLYFTGASEDPEFGYNENSNESDLAFFGVLELNTDKTIVKKDAITHQLTSFQGTSIRASNGKVYITTGDGTNGTAGGLYIYDATDNKTQVKSILGPDQDHARSVDVDDSHIYLMQAQGARITRYDLNGDSPDDIYNEPSEAAQQDAKSEFLVWKDYLLVAENESGLRMLNKSTGDVVDWLERPGADPERHVTNSVAINDSKKLDADGKEISSNMLLLANGEKGIYWYDIMKVNDKDRIVLCNGNSILGGHSANFIASTGNIVFLADGLGGLKILYIGFSKGSTPPVVNTHACDDFMPYLLDIGDTKGLLPEEARVFRSDAHPIVKTLFAPENTSKIPDYIEILEDTELHISFMWEGAGWFNAFGFFVIPAGTALSEYDYYNQVIKNDLCTQVRSVNVLKDKYIIFQNVTMVNDTWGANGTLVPNTTYKIENYNFPDHRFRKGDKVIMFMVPNGWNAQNDRVEVKFDNKDGNYPQIFFMNKELNRKTNPNIGLGHPDNFKGIQHNIFYSTSCHNLVMIIEDKIDWADLDYNDFVFTISDGTNETSNLKKPHFQVGLDESGDLVITE
ncbi:hypothetical protein FACS189430_02080 [Bacteroidia bacterium]|nr:hypothetical protein FACS189430_02080 [Bacteroidia bacterium]